MTLTVARLAAQTGVTPDALRYYERAGLLPPPQRSRAGYRQYDESAAERLRFIKGAQRTGLKLRQIKELLEVIDRGLCPCGHTERMVNERIDEIDVEIKQLRDVRKQLVSLKERLPAPASANGPQPWPCERTFVEVGRKAKAERSSHGKASG